MLVFSVAGSVRAGLESIVNSSVSFTTLGSASTSVELREMLGSHEPDIVLADLVGSDLSLSSQPLADVPSVVVLLDNPSDSDFQALRKGARAMLPRNAEDEEIIAALEATAAGLIAVHPTQSHALVSSRSPLDSNLEQIEELTPREIEVLGMLAEGIGNKTIAQRLGISEHTVKFHIGSILGKLDAESRTEAVTIGIRHGVISL